MKMFVPVCVVLLGTVVNQLSVADDEHPAINQSDRFAWRLFAEISRPVDSNKPDGPTVWEGWALARDVFANPNEPPKWPGDDSPRDIDRLEARPLQQIIAERQRGHNDLSISAAAQAIARPNRVDPGVIQRQGNETRMNRDSFDFIVSNDLYYIEGQEQFFNTNAKVDFPVEAKEVKAQWRRLDDPTQYSRYHTAQVNNRGVVETWGLTALHITTKDLPNWFWATFEHKDNEGREGVVPSRDAFGVSPSGGPSSDLLDLFRDQKLGAKWQNYILRGTQVDFVNSIGQPTILANSQVERGFQSTSSCITCHSRASIGPKPEQSFNVNDPQNPNEVNRLSVFESSDPLLGSIGTPQPEWFVDTETTPVARRFTQLDFVWSMFRARRRVPFPQPIPAVVPPVPAAVGAAAGARMLTPQMMEVRAGAYNADTRVGVAFAQRMRSLRASGSQFIVTYNGFSPEAQTAFQGAVDVWQSLLQSDVPIRITANWIPLDPGVLGSAGPATYSQNFSGAPIPNTWYPIALANKLSGTDLAPIDVDIVCNFSSVFSNWYFGTDANTPVNQFDLMSVVLHELGHGLGFTGSMRVQGLQGSWGGGTAFPVTYDRFGFNGNSQQLIDMSLFPNPSSALRLQLISNNLVFRGTQATTANGGAPPPIYAPNPFDPGSSFAHLDEATYPAGNPNSLMTPQIGMNEAIHSPGPVGMAVLQDLGWTFTSAMTAGGVEGSDPSCSGQTAAQPMSLYDLEMSDEEQVKLVDAAIEMAKATSGDDQPEFFEQLDQSLMQIKRARSTRMELESSTDGQGSNFRPMRSRVATPSMERASVTSDPTWRANFLKWLSIPRTNRLRIWGGAPVLAGEFEHCVAVGSSGRFCCTGTLVGPRVVITAAHCFHLGCIGPRGEVYLGLNSNDPSSGRVVKCKCVPHPEYNGVTSAHDIAVLILDDAVMDVEPCAIASCDQIDEAFFLRLAGFGLTETAGFGRKMMVEVVVASNDCGSDVHQSTFGCIADREIVAGGNGLDSCNGDSGGPAYVDVDGTFLLAGATSRAAANSSQSCGDGGLYVRIDKEVGWIESVLKAESIELTPTAKSCEDAE